MTSEDPRGPAWVHVLWEVSPNRPGANVAVNADGVTLAFAAEDLEDGADSLIDDATPKLQALGPDGAALWAQSSTVTSDAAALRTVRVHPFGQRWVVTHGPGSANTAFELSCPKTEPEHSAFGSGIFLLGEDGACVRQFDERPWKSGISVATDGADRIWVSSGCEHCAGTVEVSRIEVSSDETQLLAAQQGFGSGPGLPRQLAWADGHLIGFDDQRAQWSVAEIEETPWSLRWTVSLQGEPVQGVAPAGDGTWRVLVSAPSGKSKRVHLSADGKVLETEELAADSELSAVSQSGWAAVKPDEARRVAAIRLGPWTGDAETIEVGRAMGAGGAIALTSIAIGDDGSVRVGGYATGEVTLGTQAHDFKSAYVAFVAAIER